MKNNLVPAFNNTILRTAMMLTGMFILGVASYIYLGGSVGVGTIIMAVLAGFFIQFVFKIFKFDVKKIQHRFIF